MTGKGSCPQMPGPIVAAGRYTVAEAEEGFSSATFVCAAAPEQRVRIRVDNETTVAELLRDFCSRHSALVSSLRGTGSRLRDASLASDHVALVVSGAVAHRSAVVQQVVRNDTALLILTSVEDVHVARHDRAALRGVACDPHQRWASAEEATKAATAPGADAKVVGIYAQFAHQPEDAAASR